MTTTGEHLRYVPSAMAQALVVTGAASLDQSVGRVRGILLSRPAASFAQRIGPPTDGGLSVRFTRWQRLDDSACRVIEHHPRCTYDRSSE
jgi:hypothetical protein